MTPCLSISTLALEHEELIIIRAGTYTCMLHTPAEKGFVLSMYSLVPMPLPFLPSTCDHNTSKKFFASLPLLHIIVDANRR